MAPLRLTWWLMRISALELTVWAFGLQGLPGLEGSVFVGFVHYLLILSWVVFGFVCLFSVANYKGTQRDAKWAHRFYRDIVQPARKAHRPVPATQPVGMYNGILRVSSRSEHHWFWGPITYRVHRTVKRGGTEE